MAVVTICSDFGAQENKICHCFHFFPIYLSWSDGTRCIDREYADTMCKAFSGFVAGHNLVTSILAQRQGVSCPTSITTGDQSPDSQPRSYSWFWTWMKGVDPLLCDSFHSGWWSWTSSLQTIFDFLFLLVFTVEWASPCAHPPQSVRALADGRSESLQPETVRGSKAEAATAGLWWISAGAGAGGGALPGGWGFSFILSGQAVYTSHQQHAGFWSLHTGPFYFVKLKLCLFFCHVTCLLHIALQELGVWFGCKSLVRACAVGCLFSLLMSSFNEHNSQF